MDKGLYKNDDDGFCLLIFSVYNYYVQLSLLFTNLVVCFIAFCIVNLLVCVLISFGMRFSLSHRLFVDVP
jgi:hypothetical protein